KPPVKPAWEFIGEIFQKHGASPYTMRRLRYRLTDQEWGFAWLLAPVELKKPGPAVIALHQTSCSGKDEVIGLERLPGQTNWVWYGHELAEHGFVVLAPDAIAFGERQSGHAYAMYRSADQFFAAHPQGSVMRKMMFDVSRAIDVIEQLEQVDAKRIGCMGH